MTESNTNQLWVYKAHLHKFTCCFYNIMFTSIFVHHQQKVLSVNICRVSNKLSTRILFTIKVVISSLLHLSKPSVLWRSPSKIFIHFWMRNWSCWICNSPLICTCIRVSNGRVDNAWNVIMSPLFPTYDITFYVCTLNVKQLQL
jgi:hypothetical protein